MTVTPAPAGLMPMYDPLLAAAYTPQQLNAICTYAASTYEMLNTLLRRGQEIEPWLAAVHVPMLQAAQAAGPAAPTIWRGGRLTAAAEADGCWIESAWASCSRDAQTAYSFMARATASDYPPAGEWASPPGRVFEITLDASTPVIDVAAALNTSFKSERGRHEKEVLIAPGCLWTITGTRAGVVEVTVSGA